MGSYAAPVRRQSAVQCKLTFHDVADTSRSSSSCRRAATCTTVRFMLAGGEPPGLLGLPAAGGLAGLAGLVVGAGPAICSEYSCRHGKTSLHIMIHSGNGYLAVMPLNT